MAWTARRTWLTGAFLGLALAGCAQQGTAPPAPAAGQAGVLNIADAAIASDDPEMALKVSQSVLATDPNNLQALYHEADAYYAVGRCEDAIAAYQLALKINPKSSAAETGIGRCLIKRNAAQAESVFEAAVADDPGNSAALNDLGIARDLQGNYAGATGPYQQALLADPGDLAVEVNLGFSLALSGDGEDAVQYLGPLATGSAASPKIREDYALALVAVGHQDQARQVLAVDLPPDQVNTLMGQFAEAIASAPKPAAPAAAAPTVTPAAPVAPVAVQLLTPAPAAPPPQTAVTVAPVTVAPVTVALAPPAPKPAAPPVALGAMAPTVAPTPPPAAAPTPPAAAGDDILR
jgi:Flp pilus assembly protein TadD